jgi:hypothetical protein
VILFEPEITQAEDGRVLHQGTHESGLTTRNIPSKRITNGSPLSITGTCTGGGIIDASCYPSYSPALPEACGGMVR